MTDRVDLEELESLAGRIRDGIGGDAAVFVNDIAMLHMAVAELLELRGRVEELQWSNNELLSRLSGVRTLLDAAKSEVRKRNTVVEAASELREWYGKVQGRDPGPLYIALAEALERLPR